MNLSRTAAIAACGVLTPFLLLGVVNAQDAFKSITLNTETRVGSVGGSSILKKTELKVDESGDASLDENLASGAVKKAKLTAAELADLKQKFATAKVATLPFDVTQVLHVVAPDKTFSVKTTFVGGSKSFGGEPGIYATSAARVKPLMDALFALHAKMQAPVVVAAPFEEVSLGEFHGSSGTSKTTTVAKDGKVTLLSASPTAKFAPVTAKATAAELKAVQDAFKAANVKTLPASGPDLHPFPIGAKVLELSSTIADPALKKYTYRATEGFYGVDANRVKPLVAAIRAIRERLDAEANIVTIFGQVQVSGGTVTIKQEVPLGPLTFSPSWRVTNEPFYSLLKAHKNKYVRVKARRIPGIEPVIQVLELEGINPSFVPVKIRDAQGKVVGNLLGGAPLAITGVKGLNYEVKYQGKTAYVRKTSLEVSYDVIAFSSTAPSATPGIVNVVPD
ncbi:MAG: hypothetical protein ACAI25_00630 [Planctomycetota bacterium]